MRYIIKMLIMKKVLLFIFATLMLVSCGNNQSSEQKKKGSSGKTLELLVVANADVYQGETKELLDSIFSTPQECLPSPEKKFDIINIPVSSYRNTEMFKNHRNILLLDVKSDNPGKVYKHIDEYAYPQVIFDFAVKDQESLRENLRKYQESMFKELYAAEHRRVIKAFKGMENYDLNQSIRKHFGFGLMFANEFSMAKQDGNFAWVRKEAKDFGLGVLIDVFSYESEEMFNEQNILDRLDTIRKRYVPACMPNSYTGIERRKAQDGSYLAPIVSKRVDFPGTTYCVETRGCWRSFGDFMAGPFVCYTMLSPDQKKVVMLSGYVFCPRNKPWTKRDLLMQVESVCWSINWE